MMNTKTIPKTDPKQAASADWFLKKMAGMKSTEVLTPEKKAELMSCSLKYVGAFACLIVVAITIYVASTDDKALTAGYYKYMVFIVIPIVVSAYLVLPIFNQRVNGTTLAMNGFMFVVFAVSVYFFYQTQNPASVLFIKNTMYLVGFLSVIVGLALAYKFLIRYIYNARGWTGFFLQILFLIPCLLLEFIEYIKGQLQITPNTVYILLAIEAAILFFYVALPKLLRRMPKREHSGVLLADPVYLNTATELADYKMLALENVKDSPYVTNYTYRRNYSVSFWAYLNPSASVSPIFKLGNNNESGGKPLVVYNGQSAKYTIYCSNNDTENTNYSVILPVQKWNYFVITYNENNVDLFVNGDLVKTIVLENVANPAYSAADTIQAGHAANRGIRGIDYTEHSGGASGAICNVRYYKNPISQFDVIKEYNLLMFKNPPVA